MAFRFVHAPLKGFRRRCIDHAAKLRFGVHRVAKSDSLCFLQVVQEDLEVVETKQPVERMEGEHFDLSQPMITTCGSGVTAAILTLALEVLGHRDNALYDGSWSEWGGRADTPIVSA